MDRLKAGQKVSERVITHCDACNYRLHKRYWHLRSDLKKGANVAKVAIASEMIRWVWAIGCLVQEEQQTYTDDSAVSLER